MPGQVSGLSNAITVAAGFGHSLALKNDGTAWAWGYGSNGQLGNGTSTYIQATPVQVSNLAGVIALAGGFYHGLALLSDGTAWAWGYGADGELGNGTFNSAQTTPVQVSLASGVTAIGAGYFQSLAMLPASSIGTNHFSVTPSTATPTAGTPFSVTVTALDGFNNILTGYTGTVHFSLASADSGATLPADYTFTTSDAGTHTFTNGVTLTVVGPQTINVNDTVQTGTVGSAGVTVTQPTIDLSVSAGVPSLINFDPLASTLVDYNPIPTNYASEPFVTVSYVTEGAGAGGADVPNLAWWGPGYGDLNSVGFSASNGYIADVVLTAASGTTVTLNGFDLAGYYQTNLTASTLQVYADGSLVNDYSPYNVLGAGPSHSTISPDVAGGVVKIRWGTNWNIGINNINFISSAPTSLLAGANLTFTATAFNKSSSATSTGTTLTYAVPAGLTLVSATSATMTCSGTTTVVCTQSKLAPNTAATADITVQATTTGTITNTVTASGNEADPNAANNSSSFTLQVNPAADLGVSLSASPTIVPPGSNITYTMVVTNNGPSDAPGVVLTNTLPAGTSAVFLPSACTGTTTITCNIGTIANGSSATLAIIATSTLGTLTDTASVTSNLVDPDASNNSAMVVANANEADLVVSVAATSGSAVTATVTNNGPAPTTNVVLTDTLDRLVFVSASSSTCTVAGAVVTCPLGSLAVGANASVTITVKDPGQGWTAQTFQAISALPDPNPTNNSARVGPLPSSFNTPTGTNVVVQTSDTAGDAATIGFAAVTRTGSTTISSAAATSAAPAGFRFGTPAVVYDISCNCDYTGPINLALRFNPAAFHHPGKVHLFHWESGVWVDRTTGANLTTANVSAVTSSLSPFIVVEPMNQPPVANAGTGYAVAGAAASGTAVTLDGSASSDADGDPLAYRWTGPFAEGGGVVTGIRPSVTLPLGVSTVTLVVNDGETDSQPISVNVAVSDFTLSAPATSPSISAGQSATYTINVGALYGPFSAPVNLTCSPASPAVSCALSASSVTPGATGATTTLTITAAPRSAALGRRRGGHFALWLGGLPLFGVLLIGSKQRRARRLALFAVIVLLLAYMGCGGGGNSSTSNTQTRPIASGAAVQVTISGTSSSLMHSTTLVVTVQ